MGASGRRWRFALAALLLALLGFWLIPVLRPEAPTATVLEARDGRLLGAVIAADGQWRFPAGPVPPRYAIAVEHFEDRRFHQHPGVDPLALLRAIDANFRAGHVVSGASTLTMQVIRLARGNPPRTLSEKALEMVLALRLERAHTKSEILAIYAAHAPFGGNTVGLEAAAWRYFGRPPAELSWAEVCTLAVLPNSPGLVHPGRNRARLQARRDALLGALAEAGHLSPEEAALAQLEPLPGAPLPIPQLAPHLLHRVPTGTRARSTLDADLQARALGLVARHQTQLAPARVHNIGALMIDVPSGEVLVYVGNTADAQARHHNHVDVVRAARSSGSTLKPMLYQAMLEEGVLLPDELVPDVPMRIGSFAPENYGRDFDGALPASEALARSRNVPAAWMLKEYGVAPFHARLQRLGLRTLFRAPTDYGLPLILGGAEASLWDLTSVYRHLAWSVAPPADGLQPPVRWLQAPAAPAAPAQPLDPGATWLTLQAMQEVSRPGVHAGWRQFGSSRRLAWKTGTSFGFRDGWAIGTTATTALGVWVGNADGEGRPGLTGIEAAAPLLFELLDLVPPAAWFERPAAALVNLEVCAHSGNRAGPNCPETRWIDAPEAGRRGRGCAWCQTIHTDGAHRVHAACEDPSALVTERRFSVPPHMEARYARRNATYRSLPPWRADCRPEDGGAAALVIVHPRPRAELVLPVDLDGRPGSLPMEAAHQEPRRRLHWHLDGEYLGTTERVHQLEASPGPGLHHLVLVDEAGERAEQWFTVLSTAR